MLRLFPPSFPGLANAKFKPLDPMSKDQLALSAKDETIQCDHPACKEPLDTSLCTDRCLVVECDAGVVNEQCEQGCVVDRAYGCPYEDEESIFARANDESSACPSTSPQTVSSPLNTSHNIDPALSAIYTTTPTHTEDDGQMNGVHSLASLHLGPQPSGLACQWGDCKESFQSRSDLLSHLHAMHLQADVIQAHKRATLEPPPYHGFLTPSPSLAPNLICDWEHCHEELTPFKAPGPSNLNGFDASLLALSNHVFNEHFGLDPYGQHFFNAQQSLLAHESYLYQQQQNQSTPFNSSGIVPSRSLRWPVQEGWNPPKAVDYFSQSNEPDQGYWSNMAQSPTWSENSPNHGRTERNSTARYGPYPPNCRTTSAIRASQSKAQPQPQTGASPKTALRKIPPPTSPNISAAALGTNAVASNGVGSSTGTTGAATSATFCCHWTGCAETGFDFGSSDSLTAHITTQHVGSGRKTYGCFWNGCDRNGEKSFPSRQKILRHLQSHTGHRPFECELCHERFSEQASLQQHMRRHTNEKPYVCDFHGCGKAFAIAGGLRIHKRVHNGEKPFKCSECGRGFAESSNLSKHMRIHTGERPYACDFPGCGKSFTRADQLARHTATHTKGMGTKQGVGSDSSEHTD